MPDDPLAAARAEAAALRARLADLDARLGAPAPQLNRRDLDGMSHAQINAAWDAGQLDTLMGRAGTRRARGPLSAEELADPARIDYRRLAQPGNLEQLEAHLAHQRREAEADALRQAEDAARLALYDRVDPARAALIRALDRQEAKENR